MSSVDIREGKGRGLWGGECVCVCQGVRVRVRDSF